MLYNRYVTSREKRLIRACEMANQDTEVREIENEFDSLMDELPYPWPDSPAS